MSKLSTITDRVRNFFGTQKPENPTLDLDQRVGSYSDACEQAEMARKHREAFRKQKAGDIYESLSRLVDYVASSPLAKVLEYNKGIPRIELMRWYEQSGIRYFGEGLDNQEYYRITIKKTGSSTIDGHSNPGQLKAFLEMGPSYDDYVEIDVDVIDWILQSKGAESCKKLLVLTPENFEKQLAFPNEPGYANAPIALRKER